MKEHYKEHYDRIRIVKEYARKKLDMPNDENLAQLCIDILGEIVFSNTSDSKEFSGCLCGSYKTDNNKDINFSFLIGRESITKNKELNLTKRDRVWDKDKIVKVPIRKG